MPTAPNAVQTTGAIALPSAGTETALITTIARQVNEPGGQGVLVSGTVVNTPGTSATSITARIRQGNGTSGAVVGAPVTLPAAGGSIQVLDSSASALGPGQVQYTLTAAQNGGSTNGSTTLQNISEESCNQLGA